MKERKETFEVISYLDETMSAGRFPEVDKFLAEMDVDKIDNASYLLGVVNYVYLAKRNGDILVNGAAFREKAFARMRQLVGDERAENLFKHR